MKCYHCYMKKGPVKVPSLIHAFVQSFAHRHLLSVLYQALPGALSVHRPGFLPVRFPSHTGERPSAKTVEYAP